MEQAITSGGADLVGIGRPMCVVTDAPKQLLEGREELPRFEKQLSLFPSWLAFLNNVKALRTIATFGVQYWFYAQLDKLGRSKTRIAQGIFVQTPGFQTPFWKIPPGQRPE